MFIVFEGPDGSSKTTIVNNIYEKLKKKYGSNIIKVNDPSSDNEICKQIRKLIFENELFDLTETFLFFAAREELFRKTILPALNKNKIILCDRFDASTYAYQFYAKNCFKAKQIEALMKYSSYVDKYFYFDVESDIGLRRRKKTNSTETKFEDYGNNFYENVRKGYKEFFKNIHKDKVICLDSSNYTIEKLTSFVLKDLMSFLSINEKNSF